MKTYAKFAVLVVAIVGTIAWLAAGGVEETKTYYKTISEVKQMGNSALDVKRLRVGGDVEEGSIKREGKVVRFTIHQDAMKINVMYDGIDPLPDTFKDGAQALADGRMMADGTFHANKIQAKCASKYEAKPMQKPAVHTSNSQAAL